MSTRVKCTNCGQKLRVSDSAVGKEKHCPVCRAALEIPALAVAVAEAPATAVFDDYDYFQSLSKTPPSVDLLQPNDAGRFELLSSKLDTLTRHLASIRASCNAIVWMVGIWFVLGVLAIALLIIALLG